MVSWVKDYSTYTSINNNFKSPSTQVEDLNIIEVKIVGIIAYIKIIYMYYVTIGLRYTCKTMCAM